MAKERIDAIDKKIDQLKARKQSLVAREKEKERKARTRRLIQIGGHIESRLNLSFEEVEKLCDYFYEFPQSLDKIKAYIEKHLEVSTSGDNTVQK